MAEINDLGKDWKSWTNHVLLLAVCGLLSAVLYFSSKDFNRLETSIKEVGSSTSKVLEKYGDKLDTLCSKVEQHDTLLKLPFDQRKEFYRFGSKGKLGE